MRLPFTHLDPKEPQRASREGLCCLPFPHGLTLPSVSLRSKHPLSKKGMEVTAHPVTQLPEACSGQKRGSRLLPTSPPWPHHTHSSAICHQVEPEPEMATGCQRPGPLEAFQSRTVTRCAESHLVSHSLGAPAEQPDTLASAGDTEQVASSVLNSKAKVFSWKPHGLRLGQGPWLHFR